MLGSLHSEDHDLQNPVAKLIVSSMRFVASLQVMPAVLSARLLGSQELELLRTLSYDSNIVQFYGACVMEGCPVLVLECMAVCMRAPFSDMCSLSSQIRPLAFHVSCHVAHQDEAVLMGETLALCTGRRSLQSHLK